MIALMRYLSICCVGMALSLASSSYHLTDFSINSTALSVTSFSFSAGKRPAEWADHLFGHKSVFYNITRNDPTVRPGFIFRNDYIKFPGNVSSIDRAHRNFVVGAGKQISLPKKTLCYVEMMGFVRLGSHAPFRGMEDRTLAPSVGIAFLVHVSPTASFGKWKCFYRGLYSNRRIEDGPNAFWTVIFYCPGTASNGMCSELPRAYNSGLPSNSHHSVSHRTAGVEENVRRKFPNHNVPQRGLQNLPPPPPPPQPPQDTKRRRSAHFLLSMRLQDVAYTAVLSTYSISKDSVGTDHTDNIDGQTVITSAAATAGGSSNGSSSVADSDMGDIDTGRNGERIAVCTVWPYLTDHENKLELNSALIYEFLRYYTNMGMKVIVFDRDGANMANVFTGTYAQAHDAHFNFTKEVIFNHLAYQPYTLYGRLLPSGEQGPVKADMEMGGALQDAIRAVELFDNDKVLTYGHCRAEARHRYGISRVIVIDFDEFLYCKNAPPTAQGQYDYISRFLDREKAQHTDQIMFGKTTVASKAPPNTGMQHCLAKEMEKVKANLAATATTAEISASNGAERKDKQQQQALEKEDNGSIFNCFSSINFIDAIPNVKSIALNRKCPYTNMHHSCAPAPREFKAYDCICDSVDSRECDFVHLSVVDDKYDQQNAKYTESELASKRSELWYVANDRTRVA